MKVSDLIWILDLYPTYEVRFNIERMLGNSGKVCAINLLRNENCETSAGEFLCLLRTLNPDLIVVGNPQIRRTDDERYETYGGRNVIGSSGKNEVFEIWSQYESEVVR